MISKTSIPNRQIGEEIVLHIRRHWFIFFRLFLVFVVLSLIPALVYYFLLFNLPIIFKNQIGVVILAVLALIYYLFMLVYALTAWTTTYLDVWTITTFRIINREQEGLFSRTVAELDLYRVQDVTAEQKGVLATLLGYGDVYIQSAGEKERFVFEQISNPYGIAKILQKLNEKARKENPGL
ncbi:MAG: PH domain-containing protein [Patescibacteria group bacterium]